MVSSPPDPNQIDCLSGLPDALLITILSLLPTAIAARTSVLCRRFRHLWEASPSLELSIHDIPHPKYDKFVPMADRALLQRDPSHPLLSLRLNADCLAVYDETALFHLFFSCLLFKAHSLGLCHLTITLRGFSGTVIVPVLPSIFFISSLESLSLPMLEPLSSKESIFPSGTTLKRLKSLSLGLTSVDEAELNQLLSELCSLEVLHLEVRYGDVFCISSQTIKKLELIMYIYRRKTDTVLSIPSLESLYLEIGGLLNSVPQIHSEVPFLRKAVIAFKKIKENDVSAIARLLNCISHVEELSLNVEDSEFEKYPCPILLEPGKDVPNFPNLKHLDVTVCFHKHNLEAVVTMLHHSPALESLKLVHQTPKSYTFGAKSRKRKDWASKLPRNGDHNYRYAYFTNLHLGENSKEFVKWLDEKCPKRLKAHN